MQNPGNPRRLFALEVHKCGKPGLRYGSPPWNRVAEAAFQLAIVLCSIAIVARVLWLVYLGAGLGVIGLLALLNGFALFLKVGH